MPLVSVGTPRASTRRSAASSAWSAHTSVPRIRSGCRDSASRPAIRATSSWSGSSGAATAPADAGPDAELKNSSIGMSTYTGPRCEDRATVKASSKPAATSAGGVEGARLLGDRRDDRQVVDLLQGAAAPAVGRGATAHDDHGGAGELGLRDRGDPVGDAGAGREHGESRHPGQLAGRLGGERRGLLVAYVEQAHRRLGLDRSVVHREHVRPREGEHGLHAVGPGDGDRQLAAVSGDLFAHVRTRFAPCAHEAPDALCSMTRWLRSFMS